MPYVYFKDGRRINFQDRAIADSEYVKHLLNAGAINIPVAPVDSLTGERCRLEMERRELEGDSDVSGIVGDFLNKNNE